MAKLAGSGPPLPEDLVFCDILIRLPVKPLLRCRAVCRSWHCRLTSDPKFHLAHHRRQPSLPLLTVGDWSTKERRIDALDYRAGERRPVARTMGSGDHLQVLASCDGLLILHTNGGPEICNPATRQRAPLTLLHGAASICALYPHRESGSYRVLCCFMMDIMAGHAVPHVHTIGSRELRCVGEPPVPWASRDMSIFYPPVLADGRIYWQPGKLPNGNSKDSNILVFDTTAESFQTLLSPVEGAASVELFEMSNGALGLCHNHGGTADLWVLPDHKSWTWSFINRIKLPANVLSVMPVLDTEDVVLVLSLRGESRFYRKHLQHISGANGSLLARYKCNASLRLKRYSFRESLVRHDFFSMEGNFAGVDEKPLFDGLTTVALLRDDNSEPN